MSGRRCALRAGGGQTRRTRVGLCWSVLDWQGRGVGPSRGEGLEGGRGPGKAAQTRSPKANRTWHQVLTHAQGAGRRGGGRLRPQRPETRAASRPGSTLHRPCLTTRPARRQLHTGTARHLPTAALPPPALPRRARPTHHPPVVGHPFIAGRGLHEVHAVAVPRDGGGVLRAGRGRGGTARRARPGCGQGPGRGGHGQGTSVSTTRPGSGGGRAGGQERAQGAQLFWAVRGTDAAAGSPSPGSYGSSVIIRPNLYLHRPKQAKRTVPRRARTGCSGQCHLVVVPTAWWLPATPAACLAPDLPPSIHHGCLPVASGPGPTGTPTPRSPVVDVFAVQQHQRPRRALQRHKLGEFILGLRRVKRDLRTAGPSVCSECVRTGAGDHHTTTRRDGCRLQGLQPPCGASPHANRCPPPPSAGAAGGQCPRPQPDAAPKRLVPGLTCVGGSSPHLQPAPRLFHKPSYKARQTSHVQACTPLPLPPPPPAPSSPRLPSHMAWLMRTPRLRRRRRPCGAPCRRAPA